MNLLLSCGFATKKIGFINMFSSAVCWGLWKLKILVPLKMVDGFKGALSSLQKLVGTPEPIQWRSAAGTDASYSHIVIRLTVAKLFVLSRLDVI
jgi:hypothetical protein